MPLRDHFHPPFIRRSSWEAIHGGWPMVIVQQLVRTLSDRYVAAPRVHLGSRAEIDVAPLELADTDEYEVRVYDTRRDRRLVAAIELISPANKDRREARAQFVSKCAAMLRQSVAVVLVDVITSRSANLYAQLLEWVDGRDPALGEASSAIYAAACRWQPRGAKRWLEAWSQPLVIGQPLPVLPLWLSEELAVPLDLEASYEQTCRDLRIP
jgi:hypothetical protein